MAWQSGFKTRRHFPTDKKLRLNQKLTLIFRYAHLFSTQCDTLITLRARKQHHTVCKYSEASYVMDTDAFLCELCARQTKWKLTSMLLTRYMCTRTYMMRRKQRSSQLIMPYGINSHYKSFAVFFETLINTHLRESTSLCSLLASGTEYEAIRTKSVSYNGKAKELRFCTVRVCDPWTFSFDISKHCY